MGATWERVKRAVVGEPVSTDQGEARPMRTRLALPLFGAGVLSAVVYAPDALAASLRGGAQEQAIPIMALGVVAIMLLLGSAYRMNVVELGGKRGDYGVVRHRLGPKAGVATGAALLVDYLLTVAVSVAAAAAVADYIWPSLRGYEEALGIALIGVMTLAGLRGVRERARVVVGVWFGFVLAVMAAVGWGLLSDAGMPAPLPPEAAAPSGWAVLLAYGGAVASGAVMVTGIEHLASSGPFHAEPKGRRAGRTLVVAVAVSAVAFLGVSLLAWSHQRTDWEDGPLLLQAVAASFSSPVPVYVMAVLAVLILYAAAAGVFRRFTQLSSVLARDGYLPRQMHTLSDRYVYKYGVLIVAVGSAAVVAVSGSDLERLVHVYIVGVFTSIVLTQVAMIGHWRSRAKVEVDRRELLRTWGYRALHTAALLVAAAVWVVVVVVNVSSGAWAAVALMAALVGLMASIRRHYDRVGQEVAIVPGDRAGALPSRTHGIVLVSQMHRPALRAIAYARAMRHDSLTAVSVQVDKRASEELTRDWGRQRVGLPLTTLDSPYRDFVGPIITYVRTIRRASPREMIVVYVPEYVVARWWERFLHNRSAARLRARLLLVPGVVVTAVPWHLQAPRRSDRP